MPDPFARSSTTTPQGMAPEWDQLNIETPELIGIEMPVAGIGSRFVALFVDFLIWLIVFLVTLVVTSIVDPSLERFSRLGFKWSQALILLIAFVFFWGYFTLFEAFWGGRTPGKRVAKIRVIQRSGRGIGLFESMVRNLLRVIDFLPAFYVAGVISILVTRQHQRLGDLAAGTLVIHERERLETSSSFSSGRTFTAGLFPEAHSNAPPPQQLPRFDLASGAVQRLGAQDLEVLEGFFARRLDFGIEVRTALAERIAAGIRAKSGLVPPQGIGVEIFLEEVARQLREISRIR